MLFIIINILVAVANLVLYAYFGMLLNLVAAIASGVAVYLGVKLEQADTGFLK
jgi:hypothetical protein